MSITLYYAKGTCSLASMTALELSGLPYYAREVVLAGGREELRAVSREGRVPVMTIGDRVLTETLAILWWIANERPDHTLLPAETAIESLSIMAWLASRVHILRRQVYRPNQFVADESAQEKLRESGWPAYQRELEALDAIIGRGRATAPLLRAYMLVFHFWAKIDGVRGLASLDALAAALLADPRVARATALHGHELHHS